ncbi:hypothetical protein D7X87_26920 [bacterium D16-54]|nr:hypothetical protein D7X87_26920 [bacterium D16-54]RKJ08124.1 hypothetical protein D7X65_26885 [bacterium D16-56]
MNLELNKYVEIEEISELTLSGVNIGSDCKVEFTFSKAALIGFATNLLWLYEDIDKERQTHIHIDPLGGEIPGNQALGFFLTPRSPSLIVQVGERQILDKKMICKQINIKNRVNTKIEIKEPACEEAIEEYELGLQNIVDIRIVNKYGEDVSEKYVQIVLKIGYETIKKLAVMLMTLANNFSFGCEYLLANLKQSILQYNMGLIFSKESPEVIIKCKELGCVFDYVPDFGIVKMLYT